MSDGHRVRSRTGVIQRRYGERDEKMRQGEREREERLRNGYRVKDIMVRRRQNERLDRMKGRTR